MSNKLEKTWKEALLGASLLTAPTANAAPKAEESAQVKFDPSSLHSELVPIAHIESSFGKNMNHKKNIKGEYQTALGALGLKPSTAHEVWQKSPHLQKLYPNLQDPATFTNAMRSDPSFYNILAASHWNRLKKLTGGSVDKAAFAWRWGQGAAAKADENAIVKDPYVVKYHQLANAPDSVHKSEEFDNSLQEWVSLRKAEESMNSKIVQAAFRDASGQVVGTGPFHNISDLPEGFEVSDEGFITDDGQFWTRQEATKQLHLNHKVQSEELELKKMAQTAPALPKLGIENRRETPIVKEPGSKIPLMYNALKLKYGGYKDPKTAGAVKQAVENRFPKSLKVAGLTTPAGSPVQFSYATNTPTKHHEDLHMMFNRVAGKYGHKASINLATNLFNAIPKQSQKVLQEYVKGVYGSKDLHPRKWHEEHLAHLVTYLNDKRARQKFHTMNATDHWDNATNSLNEKGRTFNVHMKQAFRHVQNAARKADKNWTKRVIRKTEVEDLHKSMDWQPSFEEMELAADMLHIYDDSMPEFKAVRFMSNGLVADPRQIEDALREYEGDHAAAALASHGIPITDENIRTLHSLMQISDMDKSEIDVAIIPRIVTPFEPNSIPLANMVREAQSIGYVSKIELNGKHSNGSAIVKDPDNVNTLWLLKPGTGKLSRAMGVNEERASESRREVAFNLAATLMGLGNSVPCSALLLLDKSEVACLEFFSGTYRTFNKIKKDKNVDPAQVFSVFNENGLLWKWAALDYLLGQTDRHAGNIMMDSSNNVKLIDAGSAFAGTSFNPGKDPRSFVPYYLRAFSIRKWNVLSPKERMETLPKPPAAAEDALKIWVDNLNEGSLIRLFNLYQINPQPVIDRLMMLRNYVGSKSEFLSKFYTNLLDS
jgi:hypothetical protein